MEALEKEFGEHRYPDVYRREELANQLELKEEVIRVGTQTISGLVASFPTVHTCGVAKINGNHFYSSIHS